MTTPVRSPITWFGGKGMLVSRLLPLLPPHRIYVEPFGGGASLLLAKEPSPVEVYNDLDSGLVNFFRVLRDPDKAAKLIGLASLTPYSREEWRYCRDTWADVPDEIERARRWFVVARQSFSGLFGNGWRFSIARSSRGMAREPSAWISGIENLGRVCTRMMRVQIEHHDFRRVLELYDTPETLFYLDPPYVHSTREDGEYRHELSDDDHRSLVDRLLTLNGMAILSGYPNDIYQPLERNGWQCQSWTVACHAVQAGVRASGRGSDECSRPKRVECVWISPKAAAARMKLDPSPSSTTRRETSGAVTLPLGYGKESSDEHASYE